MIFFFLIGNIKTYDINNYNHFYFIDYAQYRNFSCAVLQPVLRLLFSVCEFARFGSTAEGIL